jgi:hypothetical protein
MGWSRIGFFAYFVIGECLQCAQGSALIVIFNLDKCLFVDSAWGLA